MIKAKQWLGHNVREMEVFCPEVEVLNCAQMFTTKNNFKGTAFYLGDMRLEPYDFIIRNENGEYEIKSETEMYDTYEEVLS